MNIFSVTSPASDKGLLTLPELRKATGADSAADADLVILGARVSAVIARACQVAVDGVEVPTLRLETVSDTFELDRCRVDLQLSRRPVVSIVSVTEDGVALTADDYRLDPGAALLQRRASGHRRAWRACVDIEISYTAGWAIVPDDLKLAAAKTAVMVWAESGPTPRDPNLKRIRTEGIDEVEYWVAPAGDALLSAEIADLLRPYTNNMMV